MTAARDEWEEPLPTLTVRAWAFGTVLAATDVLPARFAGLTAREARAHLFADLDAGLAGRLARADVLVAEEHHGDEAAARPALAALRAAGVVALVGRRLVASIAAAAEANGIVAVTLDAPAFIHTGDRLRIDLEAAKIVNLSSGDRAAIRNLTDAYRGVLRTLLDSRPSP
jgi:3-isopropylmalate dehydratase small subunit